MINFTINNKIHRAVTEWSELSLRLAIELTSVLYEFPDDLKKYYLAMVRKEGETVEQTQIRVDALHGKFTTDQILKEFPTHYGVVMGLLTDLTTEDIESILPVDRSVFFNTYLFNICFGLFTGISDYEPTGLEYFEFEGVRYYLPKTKTVFNQAQPMAEEIALTFTEAADLLINSSEMNEGKWSRAANIVSILCRPEGEQYNANLSLERAEKFIDLPMSVILEVFFCCIGPLIISKQLSQISFLRQSQVKKQQK
jgi:hypothetical protein